MGRNYAIHKASFIGKEMRHKVLITGPGGRVGREIVPLLREHFALRLFDVQQLRPEKDDECIQGDIRDAAAVRKACEGALALIHLAAISDEDDFHSKLLPVNLSAVYDTFEAAREAGVKKVLFASTAQTVLYYPQGEKITTEMPARPWSVYACTKLFGEALARHYSDKYGMSMICIRISWFQGYDSPLLQERRDMYRQWCSPKDLTQLLVKSIGSSIPFAVFFGVSNNRGRFWDIENARRLVGYEPEDDAARLFGES